MKLLITNLVICLVPFFAQAVEGDYVPGPLLPTEQVVLISPGVPEVGFCYQDIKGFQLDSGYARTGSFVAKRTNGEDMIVDITMPLTQKNGYDEPIDTELMNAAQNVCTALELSIGQIITVTVQKFTQEDDGDVFDYLYLRTLEIPGLVSFKNESEIYLGLPPK